MNCRAEFDFSVVTETRTVTFLNTSQGPIRDYYWEFGDETNSTEIDPVHVFDSPGLYNVTLTISDSFDICMDQYTAEVPVRLISSTILIR